MKLLLIGLCILLISSISNCDRLEGEIDLSEERGFNTSAYNPNYFLSPLPLSSIRTNSYHIRFPNPFSINARPAQKPDMAYTKVYLHSNRNNVTRGFVQFRQISDMWLTEIKGVVEDVDPNSTFLFVVHQNPASQIGNNYCENLGQPFHYTPVMSNQADLRTRNNLGDLGIFYSNEKGTGVVHINTAYTSLFGGPGTIVGRAVAVYKLREDQVILNPLHCGDIKMPVYSPVNYQNDPNALHLKKLYTTTHLPSVSSTEEPKDFDKPPSF